MVARHTRETCYLCGREWSGMGDLPAEMLRLHVDAEHPDPFLLEAMREVDALTPAVPPMAPAGLTRAETISKLRQFYRDEATPDGKGGWLLLVEPDLYLAILAPFSDWSDLTIKERFESAFNATIQVRPAPPRLPAPDRDLFEKVWK